MLIFPSFITDQWLKRGSLSTKSSTATVSKGITDFGSGSQSFTSLSTIEVSRTADSSKKGSTMIPIYLWGLHMQVMKLPFDTQCLVKQVLPNSSTLLANLVNTVILITLNVRTNILVFSSVSLRH